MRLALVHMRHAGTGGTERYLNLLSAHLACCGHEVTVVCRSHEAPSHKDVRFELLRPFAIGGAWRMVSFARAVEAHVRRANYDLVLGLGKTWTHDVLRMGGGCHGTYLERAHDSTLTTLERWTGKGRLKHRLALAIERRALAPGAFRRIVTNAEMVKRDVVARYGVDPERVQVIYNGVDTARFHPERRSNEGAELRASLGWSASERVVLFLGTGYGRKGLIRLLEAFAAVRPEHPEARLLVVGYDSARPAYEARARALGLADTTRFLGGRRDTEAVYAASDLYVLPTHYDPFANSTLEALAAGLPVITTDANGASELVERHVEGSVVSARASRVGGGDELAAELRHWLQDAHLEPARAAARTLAERHDARSKMEATETLLASASGVE